MSRPPHPTNDDALPHVVVVGAGFAGLYAARSLRSAPVRVTVVDRRNHHLFQPLLYQVATAGLTAPDVATPIRRVLRGHPRTTVLLAEVMGVDVEAREVLLDGDERLPYDHLVLAAGNVSTYFGNDAWREHAPPLKSIEDAFEVRRRILLAFERAERTSDPAVRERELRFVVVGAGPTGVELAGALRDIAHRTLARDFRRIDSRSAEVILVDGSDRVLTQFPEALSRDAASQLEEMDVRLELGRNVARVDDSGVELESGERIAAGTVLWAAGVRPSPLGEALGVERTRDGRVRVESDLSVPGHREVFVAGDLAAVRQENGEWVPGMAPGAIQMGRHAAECIRRDLAGEPRADFRYKDRGLLATIGRSRAVALVFGRRFSGLPAWLLWVFVHVFWLIGFRERLVVLFEWAWAWLTWQRSARVVVASEPTDRERPS